jgi:holo-[acyl-carrier protein] synthase
VTDGSDATTPAAAAGPEVGPVTGPSMGPSIGPVMGPGTGPVMGVGMDLVDVDRMRAAVARTPGLVDRVFTAAEAEWASAARDPAERLAARFAAKEAVLKAMGVGLGAAPLRSIEVVRAPSGQPSVVLHGQAGELAGRLGVHTWHLSLTHTSGTAGAVVVAVGSPGAVGSLGVGVPSGGPSGVVDG